MLGQKIDRDHTATLDVALILYGGNLFHFSAFNIHQRKNVTVAEMTGPLPVKTAIFNGRYCYSSILHLNFLLV
jgi:hypothetical protein